MQFNAISHGSYVTGKLYPLYDEISGLYIAAQWPSALRFWLEIQFVTTKLIIFLDPSHFS